MNISKWMSVGLSILIAASLPVSYAMASDWPMFHHDLALSGYTNDRAPNNSQLAWAYQTGSAVESSPAVVGNRVYIGSTDGYMYCLDKYTGQKIWSYFTSSSVQSSPAVFAGAVYFLSTNGTFYALDANNGSLLWSKVIGPGPWDWSSPAVHNGSVFIASSTGTLYSLDITSGGSTNWSVFVGGTPDSPITVVNGLVYTGTHNFDNSSSTLVAVSETTGAIVWTYDYYLSHGGITGMVNSNGAAVVDGDNNGQLDAYFGVYNWGGTDNQAVNVNATTGAETWTQNINGNSTSTPAVHAGKIYIGSDDGKLYALNAIDGSVAWSFQTAASVWSAPAVSGDGKVCFGSLDHFVYCLNANTGGLIWSYDTGTSRLRSSPAISDGMLFIGNENGRVYAFGPLRIDIDIKPGSDPNCFNNNGHGVIPVAIFGAAGFEVRNIDAGSISLAGLAVKAVGKSNKLLAHFDDVNNDGIEDLVVQIEDSDGTLTQGDSTAVVTGNLFDGTQFEGMDTICVVQ